MVLWSASHEDVGNQELVRMIKADKTKFLAGVRRGWEQQRSKSLA
jgi:hypothetical protein